MKSNKETSDRYVELMKRLRRGEEILSFSSFSNFIDCPLSFVDYKLREKVKTPAMFRGKVLHAAILEPDLFDEMYAVEPHQKPVSSNQKQYCENRAAGEDMRTAYLNSYADETITPAVSVKISEMERELGEYIKFCKEKGDREVVSNSLYSDAMRIKDRVYRNESAAWLLNEMTETEKPVEWSLKGFNWRGYIDATGPQYRADLKFLRTTNPKKLKWEILEKRYHWQVGNFYGIPDKMEDGGDKDAYILAVSPEGYCTVVEVEQKIIDAQWDEIDRMVTYFKKCIFKGEFGKSYDFWPSDGIYRLSQI